jgi:D-alanyl-D-alanine carboxypeptidase
VPNGANITVKNLLNHTSGLYNYTDDVPPAVDEAFTTALLGSFCPS